MRRLTKQAANITLYHATSVDSFLSIASSGEIRPQEVIMSDWSNEEYIDHYFDGDRDAYEEKLKNYQGYTFFASDRYTAQEYGARAANKSSISNMYVILVAELPEEILMPDLNDMPGAETWKESADEIGQVCVLGSVSFDQIVSLIICENTYFHMSIETTLANWKEDVKKETASHVRRGYVRLDRLLDLWDQLGIEYNPELRNSLL